MRVVVGGFVVAKSAQRFHDCALGLRLAGVNYVVDFGHVPEVWMFFFAVGGGDPAVMGVGIAEELPIAEVASQQAELPHVVSDIFADIADRTIGADDYFLIVFGDFVGLGRSRRVA